MYREFVNIIMNIYREDIGDTCIDRLAGVNIENFSVHDLFYLHFIIIMYDVQYVCIYVCITIGDGQ